METLTQTWGELKRASRKNGIAAIKGRSQYTTLQDNQSIGERELKPFRTKSAPVTGRENVFGDEKGKKDVIRGVVSGSVRWGGFGGVKGAHNEIVSLDREELQNGEGLLTKSLGGKRRDWVGGLAALVQRAPDLPVGE